MLHLSLEPCHQSVRLVTSGDPRLANCDLAICRHPGSGLSLQERLPFRQRGLESRCEDGGSSAQTSPAVQFQSQHLTMFGYCYYLQSTSRPRQSSGSSLLLLFTSSALLFVCPLSLHDPIIRGAAAAVLNSNHAVKDEPEPVLAVAAAARCWESGECAADGGGDTRNSSAGNYDLHTDAGTTTTTTSLTLAPHCTCTHCPARHCPVVLETKVIRMFPKISQSRRRPLLGPSPG